ncbi:CrcB family protein [Mannheimia granulomatis]|uniref:CrcB family protein n=1 Tax=Mannheimia granulomatis TaxID=85402 RepID=UPI00047E5776|nr:CrcB family protein [Mannheimia granulomatis]QLB18218.1 chromosome condensation protein CrcB [Mannheimia granulomatis]
MYTIFLLSSGAILGALIRWALSVWLNPIFSQLAFGTLLVNWLGCFLIGIAIGFNLGEHEKLLLITGFLGSFTTFSSFSAELSEKLLADKWGEFTMVLSLHLVGGIVLTICGILITRWLTSG